MRLALIILIWLGTGASTPVSRKLLPVNDTVYSATTISTANSTQQQQQQQQQHKGVKIDVRSPVPTKVSKEDVISWITYAMRLMASKINITLATAEHDDSLPRENIEKLRNSSLMLNHFIDDLKEETKRFNATKSLMSAGFKNQGQDQLSKASNTEQTTQYAKSQSFDFFTNRPVDIQNIVRPPDPLGSLNLVQIRNHIAYPAAATTSAINEAATNAMTTAMMAGGDGGTISVPFEAYVTITRDGVSLVPPTTPDTATTTKMMSATMTTSTKMPRQQQSQKKKNKKTQQGKGSHGASTEQIPDKVAPARGKKKTDTNKTEVLFEGDATTAKSSSKNKKNKKKATTKRPSFLSMFMNRGKKKKPQKQSDDDEDFDDEDANGDFGGQSNQDEYADNDNEGGGGGGGSDDDAGFRDDYEYDEDEGSLGSLEDLIPLVIPILEDISDPESETDLGEFLAAAVPLLQGISEPDPVTGEGPDIVGVLLPVLQTVSVGKDGMGSDSGAILGPLIQLLGPFIGPLSGPLVGPLSSTLSGNGPNGIALGKIIGSLSRYLAEEMDGMSIISGIVSSVLPILSKELSGPDSNIDVGKLVSQVVVGTSSGLSMGLSGGSSTGDGHHGYAYGPPPAPAYGAPPASPAQGNFANFLNPPPPGRPASFQAQQPNKRPGSSTSAKKPNKSSFFRPQATQYRPQATHAEIPAESTHKNKHKPPATNYNYNSYNHNNHNSYQRPNGYTNHQDSYELAEDHHYGAYGARPVNPFDLLGKSIKELLSGSINLFSAILSTSTASAGASSQQSAAGSASGSSSPHQMHGGYGYGPPPATHYGAPTTNNQNYQSAPQKFG